MAQVKTCVIFSGFPNHFVLHLQVHGAQTSENVWVREYHVQKRSFTEVKYCSLRHLEFLKAYIQRAKEGQKVLHTERKN